MKELLQRPETPELIFGLVAPIGVDLDEVATKLTESLNKMSYDAHELKLTKLMREVDVGLSLMATGTIESYKERIAYANRVRSKLGLDGLSALAISAIRSYREEVQGNEEFDSNSITAPEETPLPSTAYIIKQVKRPEEALLLRSVYGRQFVLIAANASVELREKRIADRARAAGGGLVSEVESRAQAAKLIEQDANESDDENGQRVRDAFPLADVFVDASNSEKLKESIERFIKLLFGHNQITPTHDEHAMFIAKSASLRSSDLSRQVGAAIFRQSGEVISLGCNEVPKAGGGTYWAEDKNDARDFRLGYDPNERMKNEVLVDLFDRLKAGGFLSAELMKIDAAVEIAKAVLSDPRVDSSKAMDLIEFGRIIHAEMSALGDAARKGLAVENSTLFCTTFPCHLCASNIVASGLARVVYIEPYPKSYAKHLHEDSITLSGEPGKVSFEPFVGVAPLRYRDLFEKNKRKHSGNAQEWHGGKAAPVIDVFYPSYFEAENVIVAALEKLLTPVKALPAPKPEEPPVGG